MDFNLFRIPSLIEAERTKFEKIIANFKLELSQNGLNYKQTDSVIKLTENLFTHTQNSIDFLLKNTNTQPAKIVNDILGHGKKVLESINSHSKRLKQMKNSDKFVEPQEMSTGFKKKRIFDKAAGCVVSKSVQTTFQFVPISETLTALFSSADFEQIYMNYNDEKDHTCIENTYTNFCCGSIFKSNDFFVLNKNAIQIRLFTDDFEPCDPLKSKAGVHNTTAFYFYINNLPPKVHSKCDNIYLVALSDASDAKSELANVDVVLDTILADLKMIETKGIATGSGAILKTCLIGVIFDNKGGNNLFGFSGGFNANYYCRICTSKRQDCQKMVTENPQTIRTKREYDETIEKIRTANLNLTETKGVKASCSLNTLENFHILSNISVDLMHDVFEGAAVFLLKEVFEYCVAKKIATFEHLKTLVECFYYGNLWKRNAPSTLNLERKNLGQNASQSQCLILHLPFILHQFKSQIEPIWPAVESMLQIIQILLSDQINETDLEKLNESTVTHLECYQQFFGRLLKPKHHFLLHYARVIRSMGPVIRFWALRMEAKHQIFKRMVHGTNNFINIKKTLAYKHQEHFYDTPYSLEDDVSFGEHKDFVECEDFEKYLVSLKELDFVNDVICNASTAKWIKVNDRLFKPGFLVAFEKQFFEIQYILCIQSEVLFLCNRSYDVLCYESFLNSLKLKDKSEITILNLNRLKNNKPCEKKNIGESIYVIADSLNIFQMSLS